MFFYVDFGKPDAQQCGRNHRADERRAVAANQHGGGYAFGTDAKIFPDTNHDGQHAVKIAVGVENQSQRYTERADYNGQMFSENFGQNQRDKIGHAINYAGNFRAVNRHFLRVCW